MINHTLSELFDAMRSDMGVMSEHHWSEDALYLELINSDDEILRNYEIIFFEED